MFNVWRTKRYCIALCEMFHCFAIEIPSNSNPVPFCRDMQFFRQTDNYSNWFQLKFMHQLTVKRIENDCIGFDWNAMTMPKSDKHWLRIQNAVTAPKQSADKWKKVDALFLSLSLSTNIRSELQLELFMIIGLSEARNTWICSQSHFFLWICFRSVYRVLA